MRDVLIIGGACLVAIGIGVWLYVDGGGKPVRSTGPVDFAVVESGIDAGGITERNYFRIRSANELAELRAAMFGTAGTDIVPPINFAEEEVLAVFDGMHPTGGFDIAIVSVVDTPTARTVVIRRTVPGEACFTASVVTSPYVLVRLPASTLPIERIEQVEETPCN